MSNWDDIKEGDRVKVTGHGEVHEFTVRSLIELEHRSIKGLTGSRAICFYDDAGWTVEILQPPLPTEPGVYAAGDWDGVESGLWVLADGSWWKATRYERRLFENDRVPRDLVRLVKETQA